MLFSTLLNGFRRKCGDYPSGSSCEFSDQQLSEFFYDAVISYDKRAIQVYDVSGTGLSMTITPTTSNDDLDLIYMYGNREVSAYKYKVARNKSFVLSDAAGRLDFRSMFVSFREDLEKIDEDIAIAERLRDQRSWESGMYSYTEDLSRYMASSGSNV